MIKIFGVHKSFGSQLLFDDLSVAVNRGEKLGLKQGKTAIYTSVTNMIIPFMLGFCTV